MRDTCAHILHEFKQVVIQLVVAVGNFYCKFPQSLFLGKMLHLIDQGRILTANFQNILYEHYYFIKNSLIEKKKLNLKYVCLCHETAIVVVFSFFRNKFQNKIQTLYVVFKLLPQYKRYYALTLYRLLLLLYIAELLSITSSIFAIQTTLLCSGCC